MANAPQVDRVHLLHDSCITTCPECGTTVDAASPNQIAELMVLHLANAHGYQFAKGDAMTFTIRLTVKFGDITIE